MIDVNRLLSMRRPQKLQEISVELVAVVSDVFLRIFADEMHLPDVRFGLGMHFEAAFYCQHKIPGRGHSESLPIFVAALLFANLAVPSQALKSFGFEFGVEIFRRTNFCARHDCCCTA